MRSLCSLRVDMSEFILEPLYKGLEDKNAYVRKTAVMGIVKIFGINPALIQQAQLVRVLYHMLQDKDPSVVINCILALQEILGHQMVLNDSLIDYLVERMPEFTTWGQCTVLELLSHQTFSDEAKIISIMNGIDQLLSISNSAVVLAVVKCMLSVSRTIEAVFNHVFVRVKEPLLLLVDTLDDEELQFGTLVQIKTLTQKNRGLFNVDFRKFYCKNAEASYIQCLKIQILARVTDDVNFVHVLRELREYTMMKDTVAEATIQAIAEIALQQPEATSLSLDILADLLIIDRNVVRDQIVIGLQDLLRVYHEYRPRFVEWLPGLLSDSDSDPAKCASLWMIGEYGKDLPRAPYILEEWIDDYSITASSIVRLELLSATVKLFFHRPPEMQRMLGRLLQKAVDDKTNPDVHDRALFYYRILKQNVDLAKEILNTTSPCPIATATTSSPILDSFDEFLVPIVPPMRLNEDMKLISNPEVGASDFQIMWQGIRHVEHIEWEAASMSIESMGKIVQRLKSFDFLCIAYETMEKDPVKMYLYAVDSWFSQYLIECYFSSSSKKITASIKTTLQGSIEMFIPTMKQALNASLSPNL